MSLEGKRFEFGEYVLDADEKVLLRGGKALPVTPKIFLLLQVLVESHGHIVEKDVLMDKVWAGSFVEESNITFSIRQLRKILGDDKQHPQFIETIPRRGYRFIANVGTVSVNGYRENGFSDIQVVTEPVSTIGTPSVRLDRSRPVFFSVAVVLVGAVFVSAGVFIWRSGLTDDKASLPIDSSPKFETVANADRPMTAAISPDGKYMAYSRTANSQQSLWVRQLSSGINTEIIPPEEGVAYLGIEFSPGSEYIYFTRRLRNGPAHIDKVSVLGGIPKLNILTGTDGAFSISPDDRLISFRRYNPQKRTLHIANTDGTGERQIFETTKTFTDNVFSPDGKIIAFASGQSDTGERDFGVYTIEVESGEVKPATDFKWVHVNGITWLPDQSGLLLTGRSKTSETSRLWRVSRSNGEVTEIAESQAGFVSMSSTKDMKKLLVTRVSRTSNLYVALSSNLEDLRPVVEASDGIGWTPAGELVYSSPAAGNRSIWKLNANKVSQKQLTAEDSVDFDPTVSPDGSFIVFVSDRAGRFNIWRINADGGEPVAITAGQGEQQPEFTVDGSEIVYKSMTDRDLWKIPINGGEAVKISDDRGRNLSISPDGSMAALFHRIDGKVKIAIKLLAADRLLQAFDMPPGLLAGSNVAWAKDGKSIIYSAEDSNNVGNLWRQPLIGGSPELLTHYNSDEIFDFRPSPDGSQMAFVRGTWKHEIVLIDSSASTNLMIPGNR